MSRECDQCDGTCRMQYFAVRKGLTSWCMTEPLQVFYRGEIMQDRLRMVPYPQLCFSLCESLLAGTGAEVFVFRGVREAESNRANEASSTQTATRLKQNLLGLTRLAARRQQHDQNQHWNRGRTLPVCPIAAVVKNINPAG